MSDKTRSPDASRNTADRNPAGEGSVVASLATDAATARQLSDALAEIFFSGTIAVAAFEASGGGWTVEIHFDHAPDRDAVRTLIGDLAGAAAARRLTFATIATRDWVAASL